MAYLANLIFIMLILSLVNPVYPANNRPAPSERNFNSTIIETVIKEIKSMISDADLALIFENCFPNTLDTTVEFSLDPKTNNPDTFVITGDIPAMWQRDSANQVFPYVQFALKDENLKNLLKGVINRQKKNVLLDAYPNAYNKNASGSPYQTDETTKIVDGKRVDAMNPSIWERKYEIDSVSAVLRLATEYYSVTKDKSFIDDDWLKALRRNSLI